MGPYGQAFFHVCISPKRGILLRTFLPGPGQLEICIKSSRAMVPFKKS